jgi:Fic-DOC domain mobile mystery protein B
MTAISDLNAVPGNTPLHPDDAAHLIPNLATRRELDEWERQNILEAQKWAFSSRVMSSRDPLDEIYLRDLHRKMFDATWKWAGKYRIRDGINIGCPFAQIQERIGVLMGDARYWAKHGSFTIDEIGVRLHHRLVWTIHAFPNGNGRHARLLANIVVVKHGGLSFTWGRAGLGAAGPARAAYFKALHSLDENDNNVQPLLKFARS